MPPPPVNLFGHTSLPSLTSNAAAAAKPASAAAAAVGRSISTTSAARDQAEELNNWKLNCPLLYDYVSTHVLVWPSLCVEFLPNLPDPYQSPLQSQLDSDIETVQTLLLGTHTAAGDDNAVIIMDVVVPTSSIHLEDKVYEIHEDYGGFAFGSQQSKFHIRETIPHLLGEPNRVRSMPQNRAVFATISVGGSVTVFDARSKLVSKDSATAIEGESFTSMSLVGHEKEGWGLSWSPYKSGFLATAADDMKVCIWDTQIRPNPKNGALASPQSRRNRSQSSSSSSTSSISPLLTLQKHKAPAQDVVWSPSQEQILISVGDDGKMIIWDTRMSNSAQEIQCSSTAVNSISISPVRPSLIATGGVDKEVVLWDYRKLDRVLYKMFGHEMMISRVEFCPTSERFVASCGGNRFILVWDLYSIGKEQKPEDASDGPPELIFTHSGHSSVVNDLAWSSNPGFEEMIASVSDDNQLQLWSMTDAVYDNEDEDEAEDDSFEVE